MIGYQAPKAGANAVEILVQNIEAFAKYIIWQTGSRVEGLNPRNFTTP
jgi:hypothetical protein